ncbi:MAG TPA: alpha/beta fold hydrolase [Candidatus Saccharimonadales bacterium]|nr:alpha/beta fold hydrolase [Candidatus Saccharimonadales bacterium]
MNKRVVFTLAIIIVLGIGALLIANKTAPSASVQTTTSSAENKNTHPLSIAAMRQRSYDSSLVVGQRLPGGTNYYQYIAFYMSDGLKIYGLLTVPIESSTQVKPKSGWPTILFNHGYINPQTYQTDPSVGQYASYLPVFAENGYVVFKPDYRGNGNSEGQPEGAYYSNAYIIDDLNALSALKKYSGVNPNKIGVWGHSMGGNITLKDLVIRPNDIKAAVIWGGVVGSYDDLMNHWQRSVSYQPPPNELALRNRYRSNLIQQYGTPQSNPAFWQSIDPTYFVSDIKAPIQLDVGGSDEEVPVTFSKSFYQKLQNAHKTAEYFEYPGADHNISQSFSDAMQHSLDFFNIYLKGGGKI